MREDWAKKLKQKLEKHRKTPPPGLWESINQEMGFDAEPIFRRWHWATAAVFLALVGIFVFQNNNDKELIQAETSSLKSPSPQMQKTNAIKHEALASVHINKPAHTNRLHHIYKRTKGNTIIQEIEATAAEPLKAEDKPETQVSHSESEHTPTQDHQHYQAENVQNVHSQPEDWMVNEPSPTHSQKWTIGINASSGLLAARASQPTRQFYALEYLDNSNYESSTGYNFTDCEWEHHLPVRFGLKLNYELSPRLNLQSGISYTYLHSKLKMSLHENTIYNQTLHYLGVPLGLSWKLWTNNRFQLYLSGGMTLEKCLNDKPWQWSVNAAAGMEYILTREIGVYLEPSLGYYFDDDSSLEHYYKEHPWAPSFEFGLRLHVNQ